jgi:hypothetical protein
MTLRGHQRPRVHRLIWARGAAPCPRRGRRGTRGPPHPRPVARASRASRNGGYRGEPAGQTPTRTASRVGKQATRGPSARWLRRPAVPESGCRSSGGRQDGPPAPPRPGDHRVRGLPGQPGSQTRPRQRHNPQLACPGAPERPSPLPPTRALFGRWEPHASLAQGVTDGDPASHGRAVELPLTGHAAQLALEPT